jgi:hypothetical protein
MIDAATGRVSRCADRAGADGAAFDPGTGLASSSDGTLTAARPQGDAERRRP